jgi:hypothetical protein
MPPLVGGPDDIQGTGCVALAGLLSAMRAQGKSAAALKDQVAYRPRQPPSPSPRLIVVVNRHLEVNGPVLMAPS